MPDEPPRSRPDREGWIFPGGFALLWVVAIIVVFVIGLIVLL
mgnify:CR=1 FL=1